MKIIKQSPNHLVLFYFPIGVWIFAIVFLIVPCWVVFRLNSATDKIHCQRIGTNQGTCTLIKSRTSGDVPTYEDIPLSQLSYAKVTKIEGLEDSEFYISFVDKRGYFITQSSSRQYNAKLEFVVSQINDFLNNPKQSSLFVEEQPPRIYLQIPIFLMTVGFCLIALFGRMTFYFFNQKKRCLRIIWLGFLGIQTTRYPFSLIQRIEEKNFTCNDSEFCQIILVLENKKPIILNYAGLKKLEAVRIVKRLQKFLNLP